MERDRYSICIRSQVDALAAINSFIRRVGRLRRLSLKLVEDMILAVYEGCANIIEHAYNGREDRQIRVEMQVESDRVSAFIYDDGPFFLPEQNDSARVDHLVNQGADGGLGLLIMEKVTDGIERYSRDGYNVLHLYKNRDGEKE
ncbi:MAG: hypothetical protein GF399_12550 [Candidatus Coatesbacteria bacterium]|nr:hypothetical protein [Candidatus Coatesbacteria bacterium]